MWSYGATLSHTGVKGMKWGKRKSTHRTQSNNTDVKQTVSKPPKIVKKFNKNKVINGRTFYEDNIVGVGTIVIGNILGKHFVNSGHDFLGMVMAYGSLGIGASTIVDSVTKRREVVVD